MLQAKNFEEAWGNASEMKYLLDIDPDIAARAVELIRIVENRLESRLATIIS
jgi:hypothetical protein